MFRRIIRTIKKPKNKSRIKEKEPRADVKKMEEGLLLDSWEKYGQKERYFSLFIETLHREPLQFLKKNPEKNPEVLFLGAGKGTYILDFKKELISNKIDPIIDVLSIQKVLDPRVRSIIREDHSTGESLETIASKSRRLKEKVTDQNIAKIKANRKLTQKMMAKYSLVMAPYSVGFHTNYPASNVFNVCLMLKSKGRAYVQIPRFNYVFKQELFSLQNKKLLVSKRKQILEKAKKYKFEKRTNLDPYNQIPYSEKLRILTQVEDISRYVNRMLDSFFPNLSKEYKIEYINSAKTSDSIFLRITRN
jgi:hypothetical protein